MAGSTVCLCESCTCTGCHEACFENCRECGNPIDHCNSYQTDGEKQLAARQPVNVAPFDYSGLSKQTIAVLHSAEKMIFNARRDYVVKIADAVAMAHDELVANCDKLKRNNQHSENTFRAWCISIGISKDTAYRLLQVSDLITSSTPNEQKLLKDAPPSLLYEAAKPSAPAELVRAVKSGDITTHKEYQKALERIKELENQNESLLHSYETEKGKAESARRLAEETTKERDGARSALQAAKLRGDKLKAENEALLARPIEVQGVDPDELDRLAREKAAELTEELRRQMQAAQQPEEYGQSAESVNYDQVLLAGRMLDSAWDIAKGSLSRLPLDMRDHLHASLSEFTERMARELKCL